MEPSFIPPRHGVAVTFLAILILAASAAAHGHFIRSHQGFNVGCSGATASGGVDVSVACDPNTSNDNRVDAMDFSIFAGPNPGIANSSSWVRGRFLSRAMIDWR